jgi:hypothetical protein
MGFYNHPSLRRKSAPKDFPRGKKKTTIPPKGSAPPAAQEGGGKAVKRASRECPKSPDFGLKKKKSLTFIKRNKEFLRIDNL